MMPHAKDAVGATVLQSGITFFPVATLADFA
jgi:hypothetical protein